MVAEWVSSPTGIVRTRGPGAVYALQWIEQVFAVSLHCGCALVRAQVAPRAGLARVPRPIIAKCPTEEHICLWERISASVHIGNFTKAYVGAFCAMTHGMLRWSDLQRTCSLHFTADAITGEGPTKHQRYILTLR